MKLGSADRPLVEELRREFPKAEISEAAPPAAWTRAVARAADGAPSAVPGVPLDVQGTAFQWKVWKALQAIPAGETRTYAEVARAVGQPRAVRAVAGACARNPVALVVPCHRVVPASRRAGRVSLGGEPQASHPRIASARRQDTRCRLGRAGTAGDPLQFALVSRGFPALLELLDVPDRRRRAAAR